jgi:hypothetical protein
MAEQSILSGQQIAEEPPSREIQAVPLPQQMSPGNRGSIDEQDVDLGSAHVDPSVPRGPLRKRRKKLQIGPRQGVAIAVKILFRGEV